MFVNVRPFSSFIQPQSSFKWRSHTEIPNSDSYYSSKRGFNSTIGWTLSTFIYFTGYRILFCHTAFTNFHSDVAMLSSHKLQCLQSFVEFTLHDLGVFLVSTSNKRRVRNCTTQHHSPKCYNVTKLGLVIKSQELVLEMTTKWIIILQTNFKINTKPYEVPHFYEPWEWTRKNLKDYYLACSSCR